MSVQIYSYGGFIRLVTDSSVSLLAKTQVKTVEVVRDDSVKISLGEGPLNEIIVKLSDVTVPAGLTDIAALRDAVAHMLDHANLFEDEALLKLQAQIDQLIEIKHLFNLWQGSLQIDLNFQQLQVNALVAINNRLLESKENDERLINQGNDQVTELKAQTVQLGALENNVEVIKIGSQASLVNQGAQTNELRNISSLLVNVNNHLADFAVFLNGNLAKQDAQIGVLNDIKTILSTMSFYMDAQVNELANTNTLLHSQLPALSSKHDLQISLLTQIRNNGDNGVDEPGN